VNQQDTEFMQLVRGYCRDNPHVAGLVASWANDGVMVSLNEQRQISADLEAVLCAIVTKPKSPWAKDLLRQRIEKWAGKLSINWTSFLRDFK
jgi:hypothetical protein